MEPSGDIHPRATRDDNIRWLVIPFLLIVLGNLIVIATLATGGVRSGPDSVRPVWVIMCDAGLVVLLVVNEIWPRIKKQRGD